MREEEDIGTSPAHTRTTADIAFGVSLSPSGLVFVRVEALEDGRIRDVLARMVVASALLCPDEVECIDEVLFSESSHMSFRNNMVA